MVCLAHNYGVYHNKQAIWGECAEILGEFVDEGNVVVARNGPGEFS